MSGQPHDDPNLIAALADVRRVVTSAEELDVGERVDERYRLTELIGEGGFGLVYAAHDELRGHSVAIKVLTRSYGDGDAHHTARFLQEAKITAELVHGNTVRVFDWGMTDSGQLFLVMEQLHGESLRQQLDRAFTEKRVLGAHAARRIGVQVLQSLDEAHRHGLVHRDLKPGNIFLHRLAERADVVKVIDFGVARQAGSEMTRAGQAIGTPTHMSPEQAQGFELDGRSDLYALGVVLFECLTGRVPYRDESSALVTMMMHVTTPVPRVADLAPGPVDPGLAAVVEQALAKHPDARFASAAAMRSALKAVRLPRAPMVRTGGRAGRSGGASATPRRAAASTAPPISATKGGRQPQSSNPPTALRPRVVQRRQPRRVSDVITDRRGPKPGAPPASAPPAATTPAPGAPPSGARVAPDAGAAKRPQRAPLSAPRAEGDVDEHGEPVEMTRRRRRMMHAAITQRLDERKRARAASPSPSGGDPSDAKE